MPCRYTLKLIFKRPQLRQNSGNFESHFLASESQWRVFRVELGDIWGLSGAYHGCFKTYVLWQHIIKKPYKPRKIAVCKAFYLAGAEGLELSFPTSLTFCRMPQIS